MSKDVHIRLLQSTEETPMELLLLADPSEALIREYIHRGECFVALQHNEKVGVCVLLLTRPKTMELVNVAVREDLQGNGIGRQLVLYAIDVARRAGCTVLELGTGNSSLGQLALYQKCGFRIVGVDVDFFVKHYDEPIYENGLWCRDMIRLRMDL